MAAHYLGVISSASVMAGAQSQHIHFAYPPSAAKNVMHIARSSSDTHHSASYAAQLSDGILKGGFGFGHAASAFSNPHSNSLAAFQYWRRL